MDHGNLGCKERKSSLRLSDNFFQWDLGVDECEPGTAWVWDVRVDVQGIPQRLLMLFPNNFDRVGTERLLIGQSNDMVPGSTMPSLDCDWSPVSDLIVIFHRWDRTTFSRMITTLRQHLHRVDAAYLHHQACYSDPSCIDVVSLCRVQRR